MNKKICVSVLFISLIALMLSPSVVGADTVEITDGINDVDKYNEAGDIVQENISMPNFDIKKVGFTQNGQTVELNLELADGGEFQKTEDETYDIILFTTSSNLLYVIQYTGVDMEIEGVNLELIIMDLDGNFYDPLSYSVNNNVLTVSFELGNKNEKALTAFAIIEAYAGKYRYDDSLPDNFTSYEDVFTLNPDAGGPYEGKINQNIEFHASLEGKTPSDYEWVWVIQNTDEYFYGQNPTYKFALPDNYTGLLYVYNDEGDFGSTSFYVNITGGSTSTGGNADEGNSGSGLMMFAILIAIIVIVGVVVVIVVLRR